jgi:hypothetical protein
MLQPPKKGGYPAHQDARIIDEENDSGGPMLLVGGLLCTGVGVFLGAAGRIFFVLAIAEVLVVAMTILGGLAFGSAASDIVLATAINFFVLQIAYCGGLSLGLRRTNGAGGITFAR